MGEDEDFDINKDLGEKHFNIFIPFLWVYRSIINSKRYQFNGRVFERAAFKSDNIYSLVSALKSKLCMQTLGFSNYYQKGDRRLFGRLFGVPFGSTSTKSKSSRPISTFY